MNKYITYNTTTELHRQLTNILLISIEDCSNFYCYCGEEFGTCGICSLAIFLLDPNHQNRIDGESPRTFLAKNYNNREKLEFLASKMAFYFDKIEKDKKDSLEFFKKEYSWSLKVYSSGETLHIDLDQAIENELIDVQKEENDIYS